MVLARERGVSPIYRTFAFCQGVVAIPVWLFCFVFVFLHRTLPILLLKGIFYPRLIVPVETFARANGFLKEIFVCLSGRRDKSSQSQSCCREIWLHTALTITRFVDFFATPCQRHRLNRWEDGSFSSVHGLRDNFKPRIRFPAVEQLNPGIKSWKMHLSDWARCQKAIDGICFTKKWRAETLQPGLEFGNFKTPA
jgi:hypothetical protein